MTRKATTIRRSFIYWDAGVLETLIPTRQADEQIWVVRASSGRYVDHFIKKGIVAIGHIDGFDTRIPPEQIPIDELKKFVSRVGADGNAPAKGTVSNLAHQVGTFVSEIKGGDLVITLDDRKVAIGRIGDRPYFDLEPVAIQRGKHISTMDFQLRRSVEWGPVFSRSAFPYSMEMSLRAHQTVFNITSHWSNLYHCIYPIFRDDEHVYFSTNIAQHEDIDSYSIAQLFALFSDIEAIATATEENSNESLQELLARFRLEHRYQLSCKAEFMSPGHIWAKLGLTKAEGKRLLYFLVAYGCLFGHVKVWEVEIEGLVTKEIREKIVDYVLESRKARDVDHVWERLQLHQPKYNVQPLLTPKDKRNEQIVES